MSGSLRGRATHAATLALAGVALCVFPGPAASQQSGELCRDADPASVGGWAAFRASELDEAAAAFERALRICPTHVDALVGAGYVALRRGAIPEASDRFGEALDLDAGRADAWVGLGLSSTRDGRPRDGRSAFLEALALAPDHREATLGLARAHAQLGDPGSAAKVYRQLLRQDPVDVDAVIGLATMSARVGDPVASEALWRDATRLRPTDPDTHVGLARSLRGQGRDEAALKVLEHALVLSPEHGVAASLRQGILDGMTVRAGFEVVYESDTDGNRVRTGIFRSSWRPFPHVDLVWTGYVRESKVDRTFYRVRRARGSRLAVVGALDPGWRVRAGFGGADSNVPGRAVRGAYEFALESPRRDALGAWVSLVEAPFDATSPLIERGVQVRDVLVGLRADRLAAGRLTATVTRSSYFGTRTNTRLGTDASFRRTRGGLEYGVRIRAFGFDSDLNDGYFDPDLYWLAEIPVTRRVRRGSFTAVLGFAPGVQQVGSGGSYGAAVRGDLALDYGIGSRGAVSLSTVYSTSGLSGLTADAADYRYVAASLGFDWVF